MNATYDLYLVNMVNTEITEDFGTQIGAAIAFQVASVLATSFGILRPDLSDVDFLDQESGEVEAKAILMSQEGVDVGILIKGMELVEDGPL